MGKLFYGADAQPLNVDDRLLQYLHAVITTKLRRGESFTLTWVDRSELAGRTTLWIHPSIPMRFEYATADPQRLVGSFLRRLAQQAATSSGLTVDAETWRSQEDADPQRAVRVAA